MVSCRIEDKTYAAGFYFLHPYIFQRAYQQMIKNENKSRNLQDKMCFFSI